MRELKPKPSVIKLRGKKFIPKIEIPSVDTSNIKTGQRMHQDKNPSKSDRLKDMMT